MDHRRVDVAIEVGKRKVVRERFKRAWAGLGGESSVQASGSLQYGLASDDEDVLRY